MNEHVLIIDDAPSNAREATARYTPNSRAPLQAIPLRPRRRLNTHFVCRVAGLPVSAVLALGSPALAESLAVLRSLDDAIALEREDLSMRLHRAIGDVEERKVRNKLLEMRRTLYQGRPVSPAASALADTVLPPALSATVRAASEMAQRRQQIEETLRVLHGNESWTARRRLQQLLGDDNFQKGLLLSSRPLFDNLRRYRTTNERDFRSRDEQLERGLLRYFTRAAAKATPYATFCTICAGVIRESMPGEPLLAFSASPRPTHASVRLNKRMFGVLRGRLWRLPAVRGHVVLDANPTILRDGGHFVFLASAGGTEAFQRLGVNEALEFILELLRESGGLRYADLAARLACSDDIEATESEATAYLDSLMDIGLLRARSVVPEQAVDWADSFREFLDQTADPTALEVSAFLGRLGDLASQYTAAAVSDRAPLMARIDDEIKQTWSALEIPLEGSWNMPLYEDATADTSLALASNGDAGSALRGLEEFIALTSRASLLRAEQASMRTFFDKYYGAECDRVPLLRFYEDFFREHFKAHLKKVSRAESGILDGEKYDVLNPFGVPAIERMRRARTRLTEIFATQTDADPSTVHEVKIPPRTVAEAFADLPPVSVAQSCSVFCQVLQHPGGGVRVMTRGGNYGTGFGKFFSRFLYLLPDRVYSDLLAENACLGDVVLAEIESDADFNANLHPPLVDAAISYPTGSMRTAENVVSCVDLCVQRDEADLALRLTHGATGKRIVPLDLGFLNPRLRPPLFKLLSMFMPPTNSAWYLGGRSLAAADQQPRSSEAAAGQAAPPIGPPPAPRIAYSPRMVYGEHVVVGRRQWSVPGTLFPVPAPGETAADYFIRVDRWRAGCGMPERIYARVIPARPPRDAAPPGEEAAESEEENSALDSGESSEQIDDLPPVDAAETSAPKLSEDAAAKPVGTKKSQTRRSRDFHKPQYIDFTSPLLVSLFAKLPGTLPRFHVLVEEAYPDVQALPAFDGEKYVTELVLQVNLPATRPSTVPEAP